METLISTRTGRAGFRGIVARCAGRALCLVWASVATAVAQGPPESPAAREAERADRPESGAKPFMPGVRIDWQRRVVELDAKVVLREGMLELLACSPQTKEHESVFVVRARPWHIFQALGLLGIEPGRPPRYDPEKKQPVPATGEALNVTVRCGDASQPFVPARTFMRDLKTKKPPESLDWVFSGSRVLQGDHFAADSEGTVLCVVDFDTALISLDTSHSSSNEVLWLEANTDAIPPVDTTCIIRIGRAKPADSVLTVTVAADGGLQIDASAVTIPEIVKRSKAEPRCRIRLVPKEGAGAEVLAKVVDQLVRAGIDRENIEVASD